jgi:hypothetical protein
MAMAFQEQARGRIVGGDRRNSHGSGREANVRDDQRYEERYCAFVDILGFSELLNTIRDSKTRQTRAARFALVRSLLRAVHSPPAGPRAAETGFRAQSISDAVAVSVHNNKFGLLLLFNSIETMALDLLAQGFFVRGAIVKGPLYHDDTMVFGEALMHAFHLENTVARYPRIVVARTVAEDVQTYALHKGMTETEMPHVHLFEDRVRQAEDGPMYLNVLRRIRLGLDEEQSLKKYFSVREHLVRRFSESVDNPNHFEKAQWFARYWNEVMRGDFYIEEEFQPIERVGLKSRASSRV